jgi:nitrogen fixation protein FixH
MAADFQAQGVVLAIGGSDGSVRLFEGGGPADALERWLVRLDRRPKGSKNRTVIAAYTHSGPLIEPQEIGQGRWIFALRAAKGDEAKHCLATPRNTFQWKAAGSQALDKPPNRLACFLMTSRPVRPN